MNKTAGAGLGQKVKALFGVFGLGSLVVLSWPGRVWAHEAYVLDKDVFQAGLQKTSLDAFTALSRGDNLHTFLVITLAVLVCLVLNFLLRHSRLGHKIDNGFERLAPFGPLIIRLTIAIAFFFSAWTMSFLGPELSLATLPLAHLLQITLFAVSIMLVLGFLTELAALVALVIFSVAAIQFGWYLMTYLNYLGEIMALVLFGAHRFSLDRLIFGLRERLPRIAKYETSIIRISYGVALIYAAITIKLLHPILTETVVVNYHLTQFHWLFPADPMLIVFGGALAEMAIGLFILLGFEMRLTILVSLFYITLSLLYFGEAVWPHLLLYGISLNLLFEPETFTLDDFFDTHPLWLRRKRDAVLQTAEVG
jgi:uncharacterized membrane protein YphA (DoxX/SURF4 family)